MPRLDADIAVIGAGVVGLAIARAFAEKGRDVLVLEQEDRPGMMTSSRNSGVVHAGLYYPKDSLKARLCVRGRDLLWQYCIARTIACKRCGKLVMAENKQEGDQLKALAKLAQENGVLDIELMTPQAFHDLEREICGELALWSPSSGIVDQHEFMLALEGDIEAAGGLIVCHACVHSGVRDGGTIRLRVGGLAETEITVATVINAAGLGAVDIAGRLLPLSGYSPPRIYYAKGHYFKFNGKPPFTHLIYPMHTSSGLGIHAGLDITGQIRFGPDVRWTDQIDYTVPQELKNIFVKEIAKYWPKVVDYSDRLTPDFSGIRPKLVTKGMPMADFMILGPKDHGLEGVVHLFGIESPGLTSSLAIGDYVAGLV